MRALGFGALVLSLSWISACGSPADDSDAGSPDAGSHDASALIDSGEYLPDSGALVDAGEGLPDGGATDGGADGSVGDGGPGASVRWITETEVQTIDGDRALDFAFQYEVVLDSATGYSLAIETCTQIAGMDESCFTDLLGTAFAGTRYLRTGVDPSMYAVGENHYRWRLILSLGATVVDEDVLDLQVDVTSCETCIGSSGAP